jgi:hypothetical protein
MAQTDEYELPGKEHIETARAGLLLRLGEAPYGREADWVGMLNLLARSGVPVAEGVVLTHNFHRRFIESSSLVRAIQDSANAGGDARRQALTLRRRYGRNPLESGLSRMIREALIELGGRTVVVISDDVTRTRLGSIPEVLGALLGAWLSVEGLKRQIEAAADGEEPPTWPLLIQREIHTG